MLLLYMLPEQLASLFPNRHYMLGLCFHNLEIKTGAKSCALLQTDCFSLPAAFFFACVSAICWRTLSCVGAS